MNVTASGNSEDINVAGAGVMGVQITGTFVATLTFRGSVDGINFVDIAAVPIADPNIATEVTTATAPGIWRLAVSGLTAVRIVCTAFTSGTAVVTARIGRT